MKVFSYIIIIIAVFLIAFNITHINFNNPLDKESTIALIGVVAGLCAILLMFILRISKKIEQKNK